MGVISRKFFSKMSSPSSEIMEGVFAINKPSGITSAEVIRNLQSYFTPSKLFRPWIVAEQARRKAENARQGRKNRIRDTKVRVKIGHGGTLDPMATGVLIMGIGSGTKDLQGFLECTKTYEATIIFGAATDTYDVLGKVLSRAPSHHLTRDKVEDALKWFRGRIMQRPPLYSALRMDGKRLYEYAREGKAIPKEIEKRPVEVKSLEIIRWYEGGSHAETLPTEEAETEAKELAEKVLHLKHKEVLTREGVGNIVDDCENGGAKRKLPPQYVDDDDVIYTRPNTKIQKADAGSLMSRGQQELSSPSIDCPNQHALLHSHPVRGPPAVRLRMTVTSGFYVRSLSHDLGESVGCLGCMSALVRTQQGGFTLGSNVVEYSDLAKGEDVWAPQVQKLLLEWRNQ